MDALERCLGCGSDATLFRDEADVGVGVIYGPWGCACGWSSSPEYDSRLGLLQDAGSVLDPWGGLHPPGTVSGLGVEMMFGGERDPWIPDDEVRAGWPPQETDDFGPWEFVAGAWRAGAASARTRVLAPEWVVPLAAVRAMLAGLPFFDHILRDAFGLPVHGELWGWTYDPAAALWRAADRDGRVREYATTREARAASVTSLTGLMARYERE